MIINMLASYGKIMEIKENIKLFEKHLFYLNLSIFASSFKPFTLINLNSQEP